jgi:hypothetical protein
MRIEGNSSGASRVSQYAQNLDSHGNRNVKIKEESTAIKSSNEADVPKIFSNRSPDRSYRISMANLNKREQLQLFSNLRTLNVR